MNKDEIILKEENEVDIYAGIPKEYLECLTPMKLRCINLYMTGAYTYTEIAELLGLKQFQTVSNWLKQPEVQRVVKELQAREFDYMDSRIKNLRNKAINTVDELLDSPMDQVRLSAAKEILNRTGHTATQKVSVEKTVRNIESAMKEMDIIDINPEDYSITDISDILDEIKK